MRTHIGYMLILAVLLGAAPVTAQNDDSKLKAISFLEGEWQTRSVYPESGLEAPGLLKYEIVMGGAWMKITFFGNHPEREVWEAHGMITRDGRGTFLSYLFSASSEPAVYKGFILEGGGFRIYRDIEHGTAGIDYLPQPDGTIYQENWSQRAGGKRVITLQTWYNPAGE